MSIVAGFIVGEETATESARYCYKKYATTVAKLEEARHGL